MRPTLVLAGLLAASAAAAAVPRQDPSDAAPDRQRVLVLEDGSVLRERTRRVEGRWERRAGREWVPVDGAVVSARLERDVLAEARAMERLLGDEDAARRVALADWMTRQGLRAEALELLDGVLEHTPDHTAALALLADGRLALDLDAEPDAAARVLALVRAGAHAGPAARELAARELGELGAVVDLRQLVAAELVISGSQRRGFATLLARRLLPGELSHELVERALLDGSPTVREGAARALADTRDPGAVATAIDALGVQSANVRANAADSLGAIGHPAAVAPLVASLRAAQSGSRPTGTRSSLFIGRQVAYVQDYDVEVAQGAAIADPTIGVIADGSVLDVRVVSQITRTFEQRRTMAALARLTGADVPERPEAWLAWWDEHRTEWEAPPTEPLTER